MRMMEIPVFIGVMKVTENNETPIIVVGDAPFSGTSFDGYRWHRAVVRFPIQPEVVGLEASEIDGAFATEPVTEPPK